jgi:solute carrier family 25 carnitine/acylcarnitine transporter 20/29
MDRYAVLQRLTDAQNALLGVAAGAIEAASTQPLTYTKNCIQQKVRVSLDPRIMYRGTPASMLADGTLIGAQFWVCGFLQKLIVKGNPRDLTFAEEVGSAYLAGFASGVPCTILELTMIQQQRFGGTLPGTLRRLYERNGLSGLFRGFVPASQREAFFAVGYLGLSPRVERVCDSLEMSPTAGVAAGSIASGVLCAALTHPFDTCKSIIQGDLECGGLSATARSLYAENGIQGFFRGYPARAAMICCCFFIFNVCARRPRGLPHRRIVDTRRLHLATSDRRRACAARRSMARRWRGGVAATTRGRSDSRYRPRAGDEAAARRGALPRPAPRQATGGRR